MSRRGRKSGSGVGNRPVGIDVSLDSGFVVRVHPLPPYYKDLIEEQFPLPDYPTRSIVLASGDTVPWPYKPPQEEVGSESEDYDLYVKWKYANDVRSLVTEQREKARINFLLANCVQVISGPIRVESEEWKLRVEAAFPDYHVPEHRGKLLLVFLQTQVITSTQELENIIQLALSSEVSVQGIMRALQGFQYNLGQQ